jgi:hypothetical protein
LKSKTLNETHIGRFDRGDLPWIKMRTGDDDQHHGDGEIDGRSGDGDEKFLTWLFRDALEPGDAADRKQDHVGRRNAKRACGKDMPEFVKQHAQKQQNHEQKAGPRRLRAARKIADAEDPAEKQQERHVDTDRSAGDGTDIEGPAHCDLPARPARRPQRAAPSRHC